MKNKKVIEGWVAKVNNTFSKESKTDELFRDISKKFIVINRGVLTQNQFLKIARQIQKHFGTKLCWVDRNSYEFKDLFKK